MELSSYSHPRPVSESVLELVLEPDPELLDSSSESSELLLLLLALRREDLGSDDAIIPPPSSLLPVEGSKHGII